jgi:hypothetical protein
VICGVVAPCSVLAVRQPFGGTYGLHLQVQQPLRRPIIPFAKRLNYIFTIMRTWNYTWWI